MVGKLVFTAVAGLAQSAFIAGDDMALPEGSALGEGFEDWHAVVLLLSVNTASRVGKAKSTTLI